MSVFAYDAVSAKTWANNVINYLNGSGESISSCSKKFSEQIEKLVQPNVWTGSAASKNYQNFLEAHQALVNFVNAFGSAFEEGMNSVNKSVQNLEMINLGLDSNVGNNFGSLTYSQLASLSEQNIDKEVVRYDYLTISDISSELNNIVNTLNEVYSKLNKEISRLNDGSSMWDGDAAETSKENLINVLTTNMNKVSELLKICIGNITAAASAARQADQA